MAGFAKHAACGGEEGNMVMKKFARNKLNARVRELSFNRPLTFPTETFLALHSAIF